MKKAVILALVVLLIAGLAVPVLAKRRPPRGARKARLFNSEPYDCAQGATDRSDGPYGFVVMNLNRKGKLIVLLSVKRATPSTRYDIYVNQDPGACPLSEPTAVARLRTNRRGRGNALLRVPAVEGATKFWVSAVGGDQVLRSVAVELH
jgi:hypothetical protein